MQAIEKKKKHEKENKAKTFIFNSIFLCTVAEKDKRHLILPH